MLELILLIAGVLCMLLSLLLMVRPYVPAAIASYIALCLLHWSYYISVTESTFISWGIATLLIMLPLGVGAAVCLTEYATNQKLVAIIEYAAEAHVHAWSWCADL